MEYLKIKLFVASLLLALIFVDRAHSNPTSSVTPSSGQVGQTLSFEVSLGLELPSNYDTRISFGNGSGGWLAWNEMIGNSNRSVYTFPRAFSESGERRYRYSLFKNGSQDGTIAERTVTIKERPPFYFDNTSDNGPINIGESLTFRSLWERTSNDTASIVDAKVRYKKRSSSSWNTQSMSHDGSNGIRERFRKTISFPSAGDFEYQFQASQSKTPSSVRTASSWTRSFFFTVSQPVSSSQPDLIISEFSVSETQLNTGEQFRAFATIKNIGSAATTQRVGVNYYLRESSTLQLDAPHVERDTAPALAVNAQDTENDTITVPNIANTYWAYACATDSVPAEKTLVNNCRGPIKITVTAPLQPDPEIIRVDSAKDTYAVGETAVFVVPLTHKASSVEMSIMPSVARATTDTEWYFERVFESAGQKSITFSAKNSQGVITDTSVKTVTVVDAVPEYEIVIGINRNGTVTASGINCPNDCSQSYPKGTQVTLTAEPFEGYTFKDLTLSGCESTPRSSSANTITITVEEDCEVRALYRQSLPEGVVELSTKIQGQGYAYSLPTGINCGSDCDQFFEVGTDVQLRANPDDGYKFVEWLGESACNTERVCDFTLNSSKAVTAVFDVDTQTQTEPRLIDFSPSAIHQGVKTLITFRGQNIPATFIANIEGMTRPCEIQTRSSTRVTALCLGNEIGDFKVQVKDKPEVDGGTVILGAENWYINVSPRPNNAPSVWVENVPLSVYVDQQFSLTVKTEDINGNLASVQADWQNNGTLNRLVNVSNSAGQDVVFSYTPDSTGALNARFIATDTNGVTGEVVYTIQVVPAPVIPDPAIGLPGSETVQANGGGCEIQATRETEGNPINKSNGAKVETKQLLMVNGVVPIDFSIGYNSLVLGNSTIGTGWDFDNSQAARIREENNGDVTVLWSDNAQHLYKAQGDGSFQPFSFGCRLDRLEKLDNGGYQVNRRSRATYIFNEFLFLERIENHKGQAIDLSYDEFGRLVETKEPVSGVSIKYFYADSGLMTHAETGLGIRASFEHDDQGRLTAINHADGVKEEFSYNQIGQILLHKYNDIIISSTSYDDFGRAVEQDDANDDNQTLRLSYQETQDNIATTVTDRLGHVSTQVYDKNYSLLSETDEEGNTRSYTYNESGKPLTMVDGRGNITKYSYNEFGDTLTIDLADTGKIVNEYDQRRNLVKTTDQLNQVETFDYDSSNNLLKHTNKAGDTSEYGYNANSQMVSELTPFGRKTQYQYTNGLLSKITSPVLDSRSLSYDADGRLISETDFVGNSTSYLYDGLGRKTQETDALGYKQTWAYDYRGNLILYRDKNRFETTHSDASASATKETRYIYDDDGNHTQTTQVYDDQEIVLERLEYDGEYRLIKRRDAKDNITEYVRDRAGRVTQTIDADGNIYETTYDRNDNIQSSLTPLGGRMEYLYDPLDRVLETVDSLNRKTTTDYDLLGRVTKTTDALNRERESTYTKLSQLTEVKSPGNLVSKQLYDSDQLPTTTFDPSENKITSRRDANGRVFSENSADNQVIKYEYDARDLMTKMINGRDQETVYRYDELSRLVERTDDVSTTEYTYAPNGNLLEVIEGNKKIVRKYQDELDRLTDYQPDSTINNSISFTYDNAGNLTQLGYPSSTTGSWNLIEYSYNSRNLVESVTKFDSADAVATYEYDAKSRLIKTTRGNGSIETRTYDSEDQLKQVKDVGSNGNIIVQFDYEYDAIGRLIEEVSIPDMTPPRSFLKQQATSYEYFIQSSNRLKSQDGKTFDFDDDGNILEAEGLSLEFDARGQLTKAGDTLYHYDAEGHRIQMTHDGETFNYLVNPHANLSQTLAINDDRFIYGNGLIAQQKSSGEYFYYHYDYRGSVVAITDQDGTVVQRYGYLPYGKRYPVLLTSSDIGLPFRNSGPTVTDTPPPSRLPQGDEGGDPDPTVEPVSTTPAEPGGSLSGGVGGAQIPLPPDLFKSQFGYNGRDGVLTDPNGLYFMRARYYSPDQRRFVSKDPIRGAVGNLASLNRYGYVGGEPVNSIDPSGRTASESAVISSLLYLNYRLGSGASIDFSGDNHFANSLRSYSTTKDVLESYQEQIEELAREKAILNGSGNYNLSLQFRNSYEFEGFVFALGGARLSGSFNGSVNVFCQNNGELGFSYQGESQISFYDRFSDPYDLPDVIPGEWNPDGKPFDIRANWLENFERENLPVYFE